MKKRKLLGSVPMKPSRVRKPSKPYPTTGPVPKVSPRPQRPVMRKPRSY